jgi:hypothetical protein
MLTSTSSTLIGEVPLELRPVDLDAEFDHPRIGRADQENALNDARPAPAPLRMGARAPIAGPSIPEDVIDEYVRWEVHGIETDLIIRSP